MNSASELSQSPQRSSGEVAFLPANKPNLRARASDVHYLGLLGSRKSDLPKVCVKAEGKPVLFLRRGLLHAYGGRLLRVRQQIMTMCFMATV